ncbi:monooxygenase family protein [uncultured Jatrophihabitans sp.]|uniref:monooxygenase family protein n=1 Tax=uncultured Jatrophihabitans sp. TaxID=1610747 RepID=UPI0035CB5085
MARIQQGRWTADIDGDFVVFLIGFRASPSWKIVKALPLLASLPKMLDDLTRDPAKGMLGRSVRVSAVRPTRPGSSASPRCRRPTPATPA